MEKPKLKPCPFCGCVPTGEAFEDMFHRIKFGIECKNADCVIQPMTPWFADKEECIEVWNRRS